MRVFVVEAYSYDPEDVVGVFASRELAERHLEKDGWERCPDPWKTPTGCGCCPDTNHWHSPDNWTKAVITEHMVHTK